MIGNVQGTPQNGVVGWIEVKEERENYKYVVCCDGKGFFHPNIHQKIINFQNIHVEKLFPQTYINTIHSVNLVWEKPNLHRDFFKKVSKRVKNSGPPRPNFELIFFSFYVFFLVFLRKINL